MDSSHSVSIIIPVHNEQDILRTAVEDILAGLRIHLPDVRHTVCICENGSMDNTLPQALRLQVEYPERVLVLQSGRADYGLAMRFGFLSCTGETLFLFDIDYYDVGFLVKAYRMLQSCDIVIGSKTHCESEDARPWSRRVATWGFIHLLKLLFGLKAGDTHGIKGFRRDAVQDLLEQVQMTRNLFDTELIIRAEHAGLEIRELPVSVTEKRPARSDLIWRVPRVLWNLLRLRWILWQEEWS